MRNIIEEIYDGNISSIENIVAHDDKYREFLKSLCEAHDRLNQSLTEEQRILLENYSLRQNELEAYAQKRIFRQGFQTEILLAIKL